MKAIIDVGKAAFERHQRAMELAVQFHGNRAVSERLTVTAEKILYFLKTGKRYPDSSDRPKKKKKRVVRKGQRR